MNVLKRIAKWYFNQASQTYAWIPTGVVPVMYE